MRSLIEMLRPREQRIDTPIVFSYQYRYERAYLVSPYKDALDAAGIAEATERGADTARRILGITWPIQVTTAIPPYLPNESRRKNIIPMTGTGGVALSATRVELYLDPDLPHTAQHLMKLREGEAVHELTHCVRWSVMGPGSTLGERTVNEGLATWMQEHLPSNRCTTLWGHALTPKQEREQWTLFEQEWQHYTYDRAAWFFDHDGVSHPMWTGYSLGTAIVDAFVRNNPGMAPADIVRLPTADIVTASGYEPPTA